MVVASLVDDTGATVVGVIGDDSGVQAVGTLVTDYDNAAIVVDASVTDDRATPATSDPPLPMPERRASYGATSVDGRH